MTKSTSLVWICIAYIVTLYIAGCSLFLLDYDPLINAFIADIIGTVVIWLFSRAFKNSSFYDAYWTVIPPFIMLYWMATASVDVNIWRQMLLMFVVLYWATRLTLNWAVYWQGMQQEDWRYAMCRDKFPKIALLTDFFGIHFFPTVQVFAGLIPIYAIFHLGDGGFSWLDIIAFAVTATAISIQMIADMQLRDFVDNKKPGETMTKGLWAWSRHPNYFGEVGFWFGLYLFGLAAYPAGWYWLCAGFIMMAVMFITVSIPMMEIRSLQRRPEYQQTIDKVSMLIPWPAQK
ncbi:MAG: DUF1295 domain-containing protein [Pseudomonadales bacterium]|nr:DUF1295 domain-containing protein [Pseudomonadales bacterium]